MKIYKYILTLLVVFTMVGCTNEVKEEKEVEVEKYSDLIECSEALEIFGEETEAKIIDVETGITFNVKRVTGGYNTLADVETLTKEDTNNLLEIAGGFWNIKRRAIIVLIGDNKIAASISPFPHSGSEDYAYGSIIDNRSGSTGTGINLDGIRDNDLIGVIDIYFYNSLTPGANIIDERHQEKVLEAYEYEG